MTSYNCFYAEPLFKFQVSASHTAHLILALKCSLVPESLSSTKFPLNMDQLEAKFVSPAKAPSLPEFPHMFIVP
jgi:hypothetical protein